MKIVQLHDNLHEYLQELINRATRAGIVPPEEGLAIFYLDDAVKKAQHIPDAEWQAAARAQRPVDDITSGTNAAAPPAPEPLNDGVRSLQRGDVDH